MSVIAFHFKITQKCATKADNICRVCGEMTWRRHFWVSRTGSASDRLNTIIMLLLETTVHRPSY